MQRDTQSQPTTPSMPPDEQSNGMDLNATGYEVQNAQGGVTNLQMAGSPIIAASTKKRSPWRDALDMVLANPRMVIGLCIVGFFILLAFFGPFLARQDPTALSHELFKPPSAQHWLGTTQRGEDIFAQLAYGSRVTLAISFSTAIAATLLSTVVGLAAGYFRGWIDEVLSFLCNVFLVLPGIPLAIVIAAFAVKGPVTIFLVLVFTGWAWGARVLRAQTLSLREREFVVAARAVGESPARLIFAEILPNEIAIVASSFVGTFIYATLAAVTLEFLGLGDITVPDWGTVLYWAQADGALLAGGWWQFVPPGLCVAVLCAGLTFINFGIDEIANPTLRKERKPKAVRAKKAVA